MHLYSSVSIIAHLKCLALPIPQMRLGAKFLLKTNHVTLTMPTRASSVIAFLALDIFYLHTKFADSHYNYNHYGDMIVGVETDN